MSPTLILSLIVLLAGIMKGAAATPDPLNQPIASGGSVRCVNERFGPVGEALTVQFYPSTALGAAAITSVAAQGQLYMEGCSVFTGADVASPSQLTEVYLEHHEPSVPSMAVRNTTADGINEDLISVTIARSELSNVIIALKGAPNASAAGNTNTSVHRNRRLLLVIEHSTLYNVGIQVRNFISPNEYPSLYYYGTHCQSSSFLSSSYISSAATCADRRMLDEDYAAFTIILRNNTILGVQFESGQYYLLWVGVGPQKNGGLTISIVNNTIAAESAVAGCGIQLFNLRPTLLQRLTMILSKNAITLAYTPSDPTSILVAVVGSATTSLELVNSRVLIDHNTISITATAMPTTVVRTPLIGFSALTFTWNASVATASFTINGAKAAGDVSTATTPDYYDQNQISAITATTTPLASVTVHFNYTILSTNVTARPHRADTGAFQRYGPSLLSRFVVTSNTMTTASGLVNTWLGLTVGPQCNLVVARNALAPPLSTPTASLNVIDLNSSNLVLSAASSVVWIERNVVRGYVNFFVNTIRNDGFGQVGLCENYFRDAWRAGPDVEQLGTVAVANITGCENRTRTITKSLTVSPSAVITKSLTVNRTRTLTSARTLTVAHTATVAQESSVSLSTFHAATATHSLSLLPPPAPRATVDPGPVGATATTATVGVIGAAASPLNPDSVASIQLLAMFAVMPCEVAGGGDGSAMRVFLAPIQTGGRSGYLVGNLILIVVVLGTYGAVFGGLLAWTRSAARTQQLLYHPRLIPLLHTLALPGLAFESAQLLYGNERPTAGEQALGALVLIASLASVAAYPAISAYFHHRVAAIESTTVPCRLDPQDLAAVLPRAVRVALVPPMAWSPEVLASARCVYVALRARPALQHHAMSAHALGRVVLVALVCAIRPADPAHCAGVLAVAAAICFAHALLLVGTAAYRIPGVTACQAAQSVAVGSVATVRAANGSTEAGTSFAMILAIASLANVAVIVAAFVLEFKLRLFPVLRVAVEPQDAAEMGDMDVPKVSPRAFSLDCQTSADNEKSVCDHGVSNDCNTRKDAPPDAQRIYSRRRSSSSGERRTSDGGGDAVQSVSALRYFVERVVLGGGDGGIDE